MDGGSNPLAANMRTLKQEAHLIHKRKESRNIEEQISALEQCRDMLITDGVST
jgi:hypothetical protein